MRQIIFGNHQQTARVFVDSMNDSRSLDAADARQVVPAMPEQRIDKRTAARTGRRMHGHTRRLVNHQQIGVFINDFQRNILRFRLSVSRLGNIKLINVARPNLKRIIGHRIVVTGNAAGRNQPLQLRTRNLGKSPRQNLSSLIPLSSGSTGALRKILSEASFIFAQTKIYDIVTNSC